ncbi:MAG: hypothetical protein ACOH17_09970 [Cellulomonas sp.]
MALAPRVVVVHRRTELDELLDRHGTRGQAEFFLSTRGRTLGDAQDRHDAQQDALARVRAAIPGDWRRGDVERLDLHRFGFEPGDVCIVVGQDGLVANIAKYVDTQPVIGIDPEPGRNPGVLVTHPPDATHTLLLAVVGGTAPLQNRAMARATLDDGEHLDALNEVFVGHPSHQSARYRITAPGGSAVERQSSSGLIAATGTGSTGWAASIQRERDSTPPLPGVTDRRLSWFVREAWPSPASGTTLTSGELGAGDELSLVVESDALVVFGDGLEADRLTATWGQTVTLGLSVRTLQLVG